MGGAKEIAAAVNDQACCRLDAVLAIRFGAEIVDHLVLARGRALECHAAAIGLWAIGAGASIDGAPENVASRVHRPPALADSTFQHVTEFVQLRLFPCACGELVEGTRTICSAEKKHTKKKTR